MVHRLSAKVQLGLHFLLPPFMELHRTTGRHLVELHSQVDKEVHPLASTSPSVLPAVMYVSLLPMPAEPAATSGSQSP